MLYGVLMMAAFNFFSHGSQDIYPRLFLGEQLHFTHAQITNISLLYNVGAMLGGILFGFLSRRSAGVMRSLALACWP